MPPLLESFVSLSESFEWVYRELVREVVESSVVDTGHWQAVKDVPMTRTRERRNVHLHTGQMPLTADEAVYVFAPNLPWAEDHFQERVSGKPTNPGEEYKNWPWYNEGWEAQGSDSKFSHTYQERLWPRHANDPDDPANGGSGGIVNYWEHTGIRYRYGDLNDVVTLLEREPYTRQAYVPMWFPEDTGAHHGQRVPCSLGWHFMLRDGRLHQTYTIRSCDIVRYLRDDIYMATRLCHWLIQSVDKKQGDQVADGGVDWSQVKPGEFDMIIPSLHCFEDEVPALRRKWLND